jgi:hypothetical protein
MKGQNVIWNKNKALASVNRKCYCDTGNRNNYTIVSSSKFSLLNVKQINMPGTAKYCWIYKEVWKVSCLSGSHHCIYIVFLFVFFLAKNGILLFSLNIFYLLKYAKRIRHKLNKLMKCSPIYNKLQHYLIERWVSRSIRFC